MKPALLNKALLRAVLALALGGAVECRAIIYVISTDEVPLNAAHLTALGFYNSTAEYEFFSPTNVGQIGRTPINFTGYDSHSAAVFGIAGDLNLSDGEEIIGVGGNFLRLEVSNNANISTGAVITVQGFSGFGGAGGGAGGPGGYLAPPSLLPYSVCGSGSGGSSGSDSAGSGVQGGTGTAAYFNYDDPYVDIFDYVYPWAGSPGSPGLACLAD